MRPMTASVKTLTLLVKMTNIIVRHLINWERRNNMHKEMESSVFFSIFQLMQFMKYQGMKRMEELDIKSHFARWKKKVM